MKAGPDPRSSTLSVSSPILILDNVFLGPCKMSYLLAACDNLGHLDHPALARAPSASLDHRQVARRPKAVCLRLAAIAYAVRELIELLADGVVILGRHRTRHLLSALQVPQAREQVVVGARLLAIDVHHVE